MEAKVQGELSPEQYSTKRLLRMFREFAEKVGGYSYREKLIDGVSIARTTEEQNLDSSTSVTFSAKRIWRTAEELKRAKEAGKVLSEFYYRYIVSAEIRETLELDQLPPWILQQALDDRGEDFVHDVDTTFEVVHEVQYSISSTSREFDSEKFVTYLIDGCEFISMNNSGDEFATSVHGYDDVGAYEDDEEPYDELSTNNHEQIPDEAERVLILSLFESILDNDAKEEEVEEDVEPDEKARRTLGMFCALTTGLVEVDNPRRKKRRAK